MRYLKSPPLIWQAQRLSQNMTILLMLLVAAVGGALVVFLVDRFRRKKVRQLPTDSDTSTTEESSLPAQSVNDAPVLPPVKEMDIAVGVNELKLSNIRSFTKFDLKFAGPESTPNTGQWTLILGDNGVGKSTILRALMLALADPDVSTAVLQTQKSPAPLIRRGTEEGKIDLIVNGNLDYVVKLTSGGGSERLQAIGKAQERPGLLRMGRSAAQRSVAQLVKFPFQPSIQ
jgi:AAA domain